MSDRESTPAPLGASDAPIPAKNGSREAENVPPPQGLPGSDEGAVPSLTPFGARVALTLPQTQSTRRRAIEIGDKSPPEGLWVPAGKH